MKQHLELSVLVELKCRVHIYEAGVEEFLSLTKYAECVVTNSLHGTIFAVQYSKPLCVFSREQCDTKIKSFLLLMVV